MNQCILELDRENMEKRGGQVLVLAVVLLVAGVRCQLTFQETVFVDPENPGRCYDSVIDTYFELHSVWWRPNQCMRLTCQLGNSPTSLTIVGERCQDFIAPANCRLQSNQYVLFPGCCPKLDCTQDKTDVPASNELTEAVDEAPTIPEESSSGEIIFPPSSEESVEDKPTPPISLEEELPPPVEDISDGDVSSEFQQMVVDPDKMTQFNEDVNTPTNGDTMTQFNEDVNTPTNGDTMTQFNEDVNTPTNGDTMTQFNEDVNTPTNGDTMTQFNEDVNTPTNGDTMTQFNEDVNTPTNGDTMTQFNEDVNTPTNGDTMTQFNEDVNTPTNGDTMTQFNEDVNTPTNGDTLTQFNEDVNTPTNGDTLTPFNEDVNATTNEDTTTPIKEIIPSEESPATSDTLVEPVNEQPLDEDSSVPSVGEGGEEPDTTVEPTKDETLLPPDYELHATGVYKFNPMMMTWEDAKLVCESEGTNLAVVNSAEEAEVLAKMFAAYPENYWQSQYGKIIFASVGFHDMDVEGEYVTIFGTPLNSTGYTRFWRRNEPNNLGASATRPGEDCGSIHRNGGLNDFFCMLHLPFICEQ